MEGISFAASVWGLLEAARAVASLISAITDAPRFIMTVQTEVNAYSAILLELHSFLCGIVDMNEGRGGLIAVDAILMTIHGSMFTFSELEKEAKSLREGWEQHNGVQKLWKSPKWAFKEKQLRKILGELQLHKQSLQLMVTILKSKSDLRAGISCQSLRRSIGSLPRPLSISAPSLSLTETSAPEEIDTATISSTVTRDTIMNGVGSAMDSALNLFLMGTRVYLRAMHGDSTTSFKTIIDPTTKLSQLDGLSISDVSNLSVFRIPIYVDELSNRSRYSSSSNCPCQGTGIKVFNSRTENEEDDPEYYESHSEGSGRYHYRPQGGENANLELKRLSTHRRRRTRRGVRSTEVDYSSSNIPLAPYPSPSPFATTEGQGGGETSILGFSSPSQATETAQPTSAAQNNSPKADDQSTSVSELSDSETEGVQFLSENEAKESVEPSDVYSCDQRNCSIPEGFERTGRTLPSARKGPVIELSKPAALMRGYVPIEWSGRSR